MCTSVGGIIWKWNFRVMTGQTKEGKGIKQKTHIYVYTYIYIYTHNSVVTAERKQGRASVNPATCGSKPQLEHSHFRLRLLSSTHLSYGSTILSFWVLPPVGGSQRLLERRRPPTGVSLARLLVQLQKIRLHYNSFGNEKVAKAFSSGRLCPSSIPAGCLYYPTLTQWWVGVRRREDRPGVLKSPRPAFLL